jgi:hypothetical protein
MIGTASTVTVQITLTTDPPPGNKLADVALHFHDGLLDGLTLIGFSLFTGSDGRVPILSVPSRYVNQRDTTPIPLLEPLDATRSAPFAALSAAILSAYDEELVKKGGAR